MSKREVRLRAACIVFWVLTILAYWAFQVVEYFVFKEWKWEFGLLEITAIIFVWLTFIQILVLLFAHHRGILGGIWMTLAVVKIAAALTVVFVAGDFLNMQTPTRGPVLIVFYVVLAISAILDFLYGKLYGVDAEGLYPEKTKKR